ncbi:unnamed protein product [Candidula unifasciata]|uniref:Methyltransferase domain-containing protein n=1 Tax=Candidula unifasciata TaxID=100452 RepID=A0A8S3YXJ8_9EUPU|nr:unnamed protein product [Candidula unifasciata]
MSEPSDLRQKAIDVVNQYIEPGIGAEGSAQRYSETGTKYDEYMVAYEYSGPRRAAETVADLAKGNFDVKILDIGAGTGLVGVELVKLGYKNIDAVDAAEGMLNVAKERNIYGKIVCQFIGNENLPFEDRTYDFIVSSGAMQENHIPREAFRDLIRVVKPGGYIVSVFRAIAANAQWYKEGLEVYFAQLEKEGLWKLHNREIFPRFVSDKDGLTLVYQVL